MAFPVGAVLGGIGSMVGLFQGIGGAVKDRKRREREEAQAAAQKKSAQATRLDQPDQGSGLTQGLSLRPTFGDLGMGMGTLSMYPPIGAPQQDQVGTPMFTMQPSGGQQQPTGSPPTPYGGNFSQELLQTGANQPQAKPGQPQTAPAFNAMSMYLTNGRRG